MKRFLIYFSGADIAFRAPEFHSLCSLMGIKLTVESGDMDKERYLIVHTEEHDKLRTLAQRSILIHQITELWGCASSMDELRASSLAYLEQTKFDILTESWKFNFEISNKRGMSMSQQLEFAETLGISFDGPVDLKKPQHILDLYLDYGKEKNKKIPADPLYYYFGRRFCDSGRHLMVKYDTKHRAFLGNTAMCAEMALIMANQAKVRDGSLVLDPFVGSGGISVACAEFGGYCLGSDINLTLLRGRGLSSRGHGFRTRSENFRTCFERYGTLSRFVDVIACDQCQPAWRSSLQVDCIVTDPPYGVRESPRRHEGADQGATSHYDASDLFQDLLQFSANHLRPGGRLVYFLPVIVPAFKEEDVPHHPMLRFISASVQGLGNMLGRVLVTMEKKLDEEVDAEEVAGAQVKQCNTMLDTNIRKECFKQREERNDVRKVEKIANRGTKYDEVQAQLEAEREQEQRAQD